MRNKGNKTKKHGDLIIIKTEPEPQLEEETVSNPAHTNGIDLNIQIKEEPDLDVHISEEHIGGMSNCSDTSKDSGAVMPKSELSHVHIGQRNVDIKDEFDIDTESDYDFRKGVVKIESESRVKEESGDEEELQAEAEVAEDIQEDIDVRGEREDCKGKNCCSFIGLN